MTTQPSTSGDCRDEVSDHLLLDDYLTSGAPEPFLNLMRRHMGLVYGTCLRITSNVHDAEDLSQECFFDLARQAGEIRTSVVGWLHQTATHRSLNRIRSEKRRLRHECVVELQRSNSAATMAVPAAEADWSELSPIVDDVLSKLPERLRSPIVMHYLEGTSQGEIADSLGVNQSTISRRLKEGIESLRVELRRLGVVVPAATLLTWFHTSSAVAASPSLEASISKIGLVGVGTSTVSTSAGWNIVSSLYSVLKATSALLVVPLVAGVYWGEIAFLTVFLFWGGYLFWRQPEWVRVLCFTRQYPNIYQWPFFPFSRWKWNSPPPEWRIWFSYHLLIGVQLFGLAMLPTSTRFWLIPVAGGTLHFLMAIRIWWRVRRCRLEGVEESPTPSAPVDGALLLTYLFAGLLLIAKLGSSPWFLSQPADRSDVFWLKLGCMISWCSLLVWGTFLVVSRFRRWRKQGKADFATTQRISELAPPRWVLTLLLGIPLLLALSITYLALMLDVLPVFVPLGDDTLSVVRRSMFRINLFALDLSVLGILPLAYLHRRIPRVAWGVAAGSVGLIGLLHFGLFTTTILATPDIKGQVHYGQTPRLVFASDQFTLWNPPNLLQNDSLKPDNPYLGSNLVLEVTVTVNSIVMIELGSHQVQLLSPVLKPHTLGKVSSAVMIVPDDLQNGIPRQMQVTLILVGPNRSQQMKQFTLPLPKDITSTEWHAQFQFRNFYEESAHPIGEAVQLGTIQGIPLIIRVETDESLIHAVP